MAYYPTEASWKALQKKISQTGKTRTDAINDAICLYGELDEHIEMQIAEALKKHEGEFRRILKESLKEFGETKCRQKD